MRPQSRRPSERQTGRRKCIRLHVENACGLVSDCPPPLGRSLSCCSARTPTPWEAAAGRVTWCQLLMRSCWPTDHAALAGWAVLQSVVKRTFAGLWARNDVSTNRGYVIDVYFVSNGLPMLKNRKLTGLWKSVRCNRVYVLTITHWRTQWRTIQSCLRVEPIYELTVKINLRTVRALYNCMCNSKIEEIM